MFNPTDIVSTALLTIIGSAPVTAFLIKKLGKPAVEKIEQVVKNDGPAIKHTITDIVEEAENLLKLPEFAAIKAELAAKEKALKNNKIAGIAGAALHAYERGFNALSQNEKGTLLTLVRSEVAKVYPDVADQELIAVLKDIQSLSDVFKGTEAFRNTVALENSLKSLAQEVQNQSTVSVQTA